MDLHNITGHDLGVPPNAEVSDGGGQQTSELANRSGPPPFAPPKS
jgi:hypothetical protein